MATGFRRKGDRFRARLDEVELQVVIGLLIQTRDLVAPPERPSTGDEFDDLVASMGPMVPDDAAGIDQPRDPALERLLPPAHREDAEQAAEFRRLTERGLRGRKAATLQAAIDALAASSPPKIELDQAQAQSLVVALTDVRLVLGERLDLHSDADADALAERLAQLTGGPAGEEQDLGEAEEALALLSAYYDFLTWLQESITAALMS